ncbi:MAG: anthranilate synthase component I [Hyphomicrobium sp.]|nr:anthranilate synthase component I [Hyphomicrobium sp.]
MAVASDSFERRYEKGEAQVLSTRLVADLETPVSAYLKLCHMKPMSLLLESVEGGAARGRYSIIACEPDLVWRAAGNRAEVQRVKPGSSPKDKANAWTVEAGGTLASLRRLLAQSRVDLPADLPPMAAGVFGYMGYDTIRLVENLPNEKPDDLGVPDSVLIRPTIVVIFDNVKDEMTIVTPVRPTDDETADKALKAAQKRLKRVVKALEMPVPGGANEPPSKAKDREPVSNTTEAQFKDMVAKAKDYIRAGDIFQVVLSQRFSRPFPLSSFALYRSLRRMNPSPFLFHLDLGSFSLVGSSPEILVRVRDGKVTIRPIAGTTRRGTDDTEDRSLAAALLADPKERSEHLMLLDLGRNDVGRVAEVGTVEVTDQFVVERYSHVMHIVSNVVGRLAKDRDSVDALMAGFPAGTVSGAPKVRAMEIIDELELSKRGPYAGCVGYFTADGEMDTCIVLRTALVKDGMLYVQSGAGIVYDSLPENEQQECINKAKAIVRAAEDAVASAGKRRKSTTSGGVFG